MTRAHVLLADDHTATLALWLNLLEVEFDVIGTVTDGEMLLKAAEMFDPDVIVSDISMPGLGGIDAAEKILRRDPAARIVFVTMHADAAMLKRSLAAGVLGYVLKVAAGDELVPAIHAALRGERYVSQFPAQRPRVPGHR
jgi:DNA-binding NarL/FixJ family response regulator